ncbi:hypothetical protein KR067_009238, partial [Drosophila pandora]
VFITSCAEYNFLREYRRGCEQGDSSPLTILREATSAWRAMSPEERAMFEEERYLRMSFDCSSLDAVGLAVDVVAAEQMIVHRTASSCLVQKTKPKSKPKRKMATKSAAWKRRNQIPKARVSRPKRRGRPARLM